MRDRELAGAGAAVKSFIAEIHDRELSTLTLSRKGSNPTMARMNEMLGAAAQYSKGLAAQFELAEQEGVPTVAPELVPTSDIHQRPEQWALHGGSLLIGRVDVPAAAGFNSQAAIEPGEGELMILEKIELCLGVFRDIRIATSTVSLDTETGNLVSRDARRIVTAGGSAASGSRIRTQNSSVQADTASTIWRWTVAPATQNTQVPLDFVLVRPWTIRVINNALNSALEHIIFHARVRQATPRELSIGSL